MPHSRYGSGPGRTVLLAFDGTGRETTAEYPPRINNLYSSAAGRLLFALAPETRRVHLVWELGIPGGTVWPEIGGDRSRIAEALAPIRRARSLRHGGNCAAAIDQGDRASVRNRFRRSRSRAARTLPPPGA
ncbi:MAG: hypothetical protein V8T86_12640 [Victivallis sp.]